MVTTIKYKKLAGNPTAQEQLIATTRIAINLDGGASDSNRRTCEAQQLYNALGKSGRVNGIRPIYTNFYLASSGEALAPASAKIASSILIPLTGNARSYTFNGELLSTLHSGGIAIADYGFDMDIAPNEQFVVRSAISVASGSRMIGGYLAGNLSYDIGRKHTDDLAVVGDVIQNVTLGTTAPISNNASLNSYGATLIGNSSFAYSPLALVGKVQTRSPAILAVTDSNGYGTGDDTFGDGQGAVGYIARGLRAAAGGVIPAVLCSRSGATLQLYNRGAMGRLISTLSPYCSHFLQQVSGNSIGGGETLANMKTNMVIAWRRAALNGMKVIQLEGLPRTVSATPDAAVETGWEVGGLFNQLNTWFASVVGQPIDANGNITQNGDVLLDAYWTINDLIMDSNTNKWSDYSFTSDGIHLSGAGHAEVAARIATYADALTI